MAAVLRALRDGAQSAATIRRPLESAEDAAWQRGYALGWDAAATLAELTAADASAAILSAANDR
jgi:hypothetical protein